MRQQDSPHGGSLQQENQHALQLRQADLAAASSAGSVSPGATVGHRPLSRAHSSPVVGKLRQHAINNFTFLIPHITFKLGLAKNGHFG